MVFDLSEFRISRGFYMQGIIVQSKLVMAACLLARLKLLRCSYGGLNQGGAVGLINVENRILYDLTDSCGI